MKTKNTLLNRFSLLNSGYDLRNRATTLKFIFVIGVITAITLAIVGVVYRNL